jgi:hypothetical protein
MFFGIFDVGMAPGSSLLHFQGLFVSWSAYAVFFDGFVEINVVDVGEGAEPGEDVADFFFFVELVVSGQGGCKFAYFFYEPEEGCGCAALAIAFFIGFADELLELFDGHVGFFGRHDGFYFRLGRLSFCEASVRWE